MLLFCVDAACMCVLYVFNITDLFLFIMVGLQLSCLQNISGLTSSLMKSFFLQYMNFLEAI